MTRYKCSHCSQTFSYEEIQSHSGTHLEKTRGIDYNGDSVPSNETIVFSPIEIPE